MLRQKSYHTNGERCSPSDYGAPNLIDFLSARPNAHLLVAPSGPPDWTELAERLLLEALEEWGVGGKTSSRHGRLVPPDERLTDREAQLTGTSVIRARGEASTSREGTSQAASRRGHQPGDRITVTQPSIEVGQTIEVWIVNI